MLFTAYAIVRTVPSANRPNRRKKKQYICSGREATTDREGSQQETTRQKQRDPPKHREERNRNRENQETHRQKHQTGTPIFFVVGARCLSAGHHFEAYLRTSGESNHPPVVSTNYSTGTPSIRQEHREPSRAKPRGRQRKHERSDRARKDHAEERGGHEIEPYQSKRAPHNRSQWEQKRKWHLNEESKA